MLTVQELANQLLASGCGRISIEDFEDWFDSSSWNVHQQRDQALIDAVFHVEELFSAYDDKRIDESAVQRSFVEISRQLERNSSPLVLNDDEDIAVACYAGHGLPYVVREPQDITLQMS